MNSTTLSIYAAAYSMYPEVLITSGVPAENLIVRKKTNGYQSWLKRSMWKVLIRDTEGLLHDHDIRISDKRMLRICRSRDIKSTIKYRNNGCTRSAANPQYLAENILDRDFHAEKPNEKWLTDVTEFKWHEKVDGEWVKRKVFLSAILDL